MSAHFILLWDHCSQSLCYHVDEWPCLRSGPPFDWVLSAGESNGKDLNTLVVYNAVASAVVYEIDFPSNDVPFHAMSSP